jgi:hypothetical protein
MFDACMRPTIYTALCSTKNPNKLGKEQIPSNGPGQNQEQSNNGSSNGTQDRACSPWHIQVISHDDKCTEQSESNSL